MDDAEARAILREHGEDPPERGKLAPKWHNLAAGYRQDGPADDYDSGVSAADFTTADEPPDDLADDLAPVDETPPARPKRPPRPKLSDRLSGARAKAKARSSRPKKRHPRVPLDRLCGHVWEGLGRVVAPVSLPAGRCMELQSRFAGSVLEDVVKGTFMDRALQPVARAEEKGRKVAALGGPPILAMLRQMAMAYPEPQRSMRLAVIDPLLLETLMLMDDVSIEYAEQVALREQETGPKRERAMRIAEMIFAPPPSAEGAEEWRATADRAAADAQAHA